MKVRAMIAILVAVCVCGSFVGCGSGSTDNDAASNNDEFSDSTANDPSDKNADTEAQGQTDTEIVVNFSLPTELSDNLFDYQMQVGDTLFSFPLTLGHLHKAGWTNDEDRYPSIYADGSEEIITALGAGRETPYSMDFIKEDGLITTHLANNTDTSAECFTDEGASRIDVEYLQGVTRFNAKPILLPKGITSGVSTKEDVIAAYGEPTDKEESRDEYIYYYYEGEKQDSIKDVDKYIRIAICHGDDDEKEAPLTVQMVGIQYKS